MFALYDPQAMTYRTELNEKCEEDSTFVDIKGIATLLRITPEGKAYPGDSYNCNADFRQVLIRLIRNYNEPLTKKDESGTMWLGVGALNISFEMLDTWVNFFVRDSNNQANEKDSGGLICMGSMEIAITLYRRLYLHENAQGVVLTGMALTNAQRQLSKLQEQYNPIEIFSGCLLLAYKSHEDRLMDNKTIANVLSMPLARLNSIEFAVFKTFNYELGNLYSKLQFSMNDQGKINLIVLKKMRHENKTAEEWVAHAGKVTFS